jgi:hypothetical protein
MTVSEIYMRSLGVKVYSSKELEMKIETEQREIDKEESRKRQAPDDESDEDIELS